MVLASCSMKPTVWDEQHRIDFVSRGFIRGLVSQVLGPGLFHLMCHRLSYFWVDVFRGHEIRGQPAGSTSSNGFESKQRTLKMRLV